MGLRHYSVLSINDWPLVRMCTCLRKVVIKERYFSFIRVRLHLCWICFGTINWQFILSMVFSIKRDLMTFHFRIDLLSLKSVEIGGH